MIAKTKETTRMTFGDKRATTWIDGKQQQVAERRRKRKKRHISPQFLSDFQMLREQKGHTSPNTAENRGMGTKKKQCYDRYSRAFSWVFNTQPDICDAECFLVLLASP